MQKQDIAFAMPCFLWRRVRDSGHLVGPPVLGANKPIFKKIFISLFFLLRKLRPDLVAPSPSLSAKNKWYSVCYTLYFFVDKTARDSNPYNLLQDEVLSKEVYNRIVCGANSRANEASRIPHSPPKKQDIAKAMSCFLHFRCVWTSRNKSGRVYRVRLSVKCIWFPLSFLKAAAVDKTKKAI